MGKNAKKQWDVLVIGAGASGMMAAITAARENKSVCMIEKLDKTGKKLSATGNGRCNFTNAAMSESAFHGEEAFVKQVLTRFSVEDCLEFFHSIGIFPKNINGYYYPYSEQAASVVYALEQELLRLGVRLSLDTKVTDIVSKKDGVAVTTNKGTFYGRKLVIATGLLAAPKLGSDGSLFETIKGLGHRFSPVLPALCGFYCKGIPFSKVSGVRVQGTVAAYVDNVKLAEDTGEIQFTDYGLSGIPVFQISHYLSKALHEKRSARIKVSLLPDFDKIQLKNELNYHKSAFSQSTAAVLLNGLLPRKLSDMLLDKVQIDKDMYLSSLQEKELEKLADAIQDIQVKVTSYRDFEFAQVCTGGIPVSDIQADTLESKFAKHVHFAGEILDVDGICGGYNLHFAWATGYMAGKAVCK